MVTGDQNLLEVGTGAHARFLLQQAAVETLVPVFWGRRHTDIPSASGYDVVTVQDPFWRGLAAWRAAKAAKVKLNVQVHTNLLAHNFLKRQLAKFVLKKADSVRVVSEEIKQQVVKMGVKVPVHVLPVYISIERFRAVARKPRARKTVLWYGRFEKEKDPLAAIEIFKKVKASIPDTKFVMLGSGSLQHKLNKRALELESKESIVMPWEDPAFYLETADVVLSTSRHESWGASMVESLGAGVAVVAPDVGIAKEAGAIVVPREKLADAVADALKSEAKGELKLKLLNESEWIKAWRESLE